MYSLQQNSYFVTFQGGYPARLKKVLIVTAPLWFKAPFKILRLFVKEKLRERASNQYEYESKKFVPLSKRIIICVSDSHLGTCYDRFS